MTATPTDEAMSAIASPVAVDRRFHHEDTKREGVEIEEVDIERANMPLTLARSSSSYMGYKCPQKLYYWVWVSCNTCLQNVQRLIRNTWTVSRQEAQG
jgi:hypothetical protein